MLHAAAARDGIGGRRLTGAVKAGRSSLPQTDKQTHGWSGGWGGMVEFHTSAVVWPSSKPSPRSGSSSNLPSPPPTPPLPGPAAWPPAAPAAPRRLAAGTVSHWLSHCPGPGSSDRADSQPLSAALVLPGGSRRCSESARVKHTTSPPARCVSCLQPHAAPPPLPHGTAACCPWTGEGWEAKNRAARLGAAQATSDRAARRRAVVVVAAEFGEECDVSHATGTLPAARPDPTRHRSSLQMRCSAVGGCTAACCPWMGEGWER